MLRVLTICFGVALALFCAAPAMADPCTIQAMPAGTVCIDLTTPAIGTPGQANSIYVQVAITQISANEVQVDAKLGGAASEFVTTGGPHESFAFNLNISGATIKICQSTTQCTSPPPTEWKLNTSPSISGFQFAIEDTLGNGSSHGISTDLVFDVSATNITAASFADSTGNVEFAADVLNSKGATGEVTSTPHKVPEPATPFLFGAGLIGLMAFQRRRRLKPVRIR